MVSLSLSLSCFLFALSICLCLSECDCVCVCVRAQPCVEGQNKDSRHQSATKAGVGVRSAPSCVMCALLHQNNFRDSTHCAFNLCVCVSVSISLCFSFPLWPSSLSIGDHWFLTKGHTHLYNTGVPVCISTSSLFSFRNIR